MNPKTNRKLHALLLAAALLAAGLGFTVILQDSRRSHPAITARRGAVKELAARPASAPSSAAHQHWQRAWTCPTGASLIDAPASWSNGWIAATDKGRLVAMDNSGRVLWSQTVSNASFAGSPAVADTNVVVLKSDGTVMALHVVTGKLLWQVQAEGSFRHGPLAVRQGDQWQVVLLSSADGVLIGLDAKDGHEIWRSEPTNRTDGTPGADGQCIAYGNCDSAVHVFSLTNGEHLARIPVGSDAQMAGGALVWNGRVYGGTRGGELVCVDVSSNEVVWHARMEGGETFGTPVAVRDTVVMGTRDGSVTAFDAQSGATRWQVSLSNAVSSLCVVDDAVFAVAAGSLVGLRAQDGGRFATLAVGDNVEGPVWNGRILTVADDGGNVIGFKGE